MADQFVPPVTATQVGSYFVQQYYQVFQQQRDYVHHFYNDASSMMRVDGDGIQSASDMLQIHQIIMSLNFTGIEIKTINSLESWNGGLLVVVSGTVKSRDFSGWRKFVQTFFLAPQEKGYFVLNDMFHFADDGMLQQTPAPLPQEQSVDYHSGVSAHFPDQAESHYPLDEVAGDYVNSINIGGDEPVQEYAYQEDHQVEPESEPLPEAESDAEPDAEHEPEVDAQEEVTRVEEPRASFQSDMNTVEENQPSEEEPVREPEKLTYASILRAKGKSVSSVSSPTVFVQNTPPASDWNHVPQPSLQQAVPSVPNSGLDSVEESFPSEEGESKSVYVRNLPSTVTSLDILQEFKNFGIIKHDGVFLRRKDGGVCYAFVEFEDLLSVQNAIKASPIELAGRQVYIEERRPNSGALRGGRLGRGGRARGGRGGRFSGRGSDQNGSDNYRVRSNGFRGM